MMNDIAIFKRSNPTPIIEPNKPSNETSALPITRSYFDFTINKRIVQHVPRKSELAADLRNSSNRDKENHKTPDNPHNMFNMSTNGYRRSRNIIPNETKEFHIVPNGYKLSSTNIAEAPTEYLTITDNYRNLVFALYNLPITLLFPEINTKLGTTSSIDLDNADSSKLIRTLRVYQNTLLDMVQTMYDSIYPDYRNSVKFDLLIYSPLSITQAVILDNLDLLGRDMTKKIVWQEGGLSRYYKFDGKNTHDRPLPGQSENCVTKIVDARADNINGETGKMKAETAKMQAETTGIKEEGYHPPKAPSSA